MSKNQKLYAERDIMALDDAGNYYCKHVSAMTGEKLHSKSDIAAELAHRDYEIDKLKSQVQQLLSLIYNSAQGQVCMDVTPDAEAMATSAFHITGINASGVG